MRLKGLWPLMVLTAALLVAAGLSLLYQTIIDDAKRQTAEIAAGYKRLIQQDLADLDRFMSLAGQQVLIEKSLTPEQARDLFIHRQSSHPTIKDLVIIDANANLLAVVWDGDPPDVAQRDYFVYHLENADSEFYISPVQRSLLWPDVFFTALSRPFRNSDGTLAGVAAGLLDTDKLRQHYQSLFALQGSTVSLLSADGRVLWEFQDAFTNDQQRTDQPREVPVALPTTIQQKSAHGRPSIVHWEPIEDYGLAVRAEIERDQLLGPWHRAVLLGVAIWLLFSVASFLAVFRVSRSVDATRARHGRFERLVENAGDLVVLTDRDGRLQYLSPNLLAFLGEPSGTFIGHSVRDFVHRKDFPGLQQMMANVLQGRRATAMAEYRIRHRDGNWRWQSASISASRNDQGKITGLIATVRDVTQDKSDRRKMEERANQDALTRLPNRSALDDLITQAISKATACDKHAAFLFIDLDNFKPVNDEFGHSVGDQVLVQVARRMSNCLRSPDIAARVGGDEFLAVLHDLEQLDEAVVIADRIIQQVSQPYRVNGHKISISCSIGLSIFPIDGVSQEGLLTQADQAMYLAKRAGGAVVRRIMPDHDR